MLLLLMSPEPAMKYRGLQEMLFPLDVTRTSHRDFEVIRLQSVFQFHVSLNLPRQCRSAFLVDTRTSSLL